MKPGTKMKSSGASISRSPRSASAPRPIGNIFREIDEETSDGMIQAAWDAGVRYYDTAPMYGHGLSRACAPGTRCAGRTATTSCSVVQGRPHS